MNLTTRCLLPLSISVLLSACAGVTSHTPHAPTTVASSPSLNLPVPAATVSTTLPVPTTNVWDRLRSSFVMPDCNADPSVVEWAMRYTRNSKLFEKNLRLALPRLVYVQQVAAQYGVPGEFVLLPWVESYYRPVSPRKHHAAGMWQIMPITARSVGLRTDRHYDGRLDIPAATHAMMKLLEQYHDQFNDWRVADYAYNAGESRLRGLIRKHGAPADEPVIPDLPVHKVTREHLVKLLAIACVVREPERFQVSLPVLPDSERLVQTSVTHSMKISTAAALADMSVAALRHLNAAFGGDHVGPGTIQYLMLPASRADRFQAAMDGSSSELARDHSAPTVAASGETARPERPRKSHVVTSGESLWQIAKEYSTSVAHLELLNDLPQDQTIQPGQVLQLDVVD